MTIAQSVSAKVFAAFVALAMALSLAAPAQAQSVSDMSLEELIAMVNQLQAQLGGSTSGGAMSASGVCPYTWTRTLNMGSTGSDVMMLQKFLNSMPETMVAASGAGSAGMETEYYGPATGAAVANFQMKYRAEILSPLGLVNPTTFFGNSTMAQANRLCVAAPTMPDMDEDDGMMDDEDEDMDDDDSTMELGGDADLDTYEIDDAQDDTVEEGGSEQELAEITIKFEDGDALVERLELQFTLQAGDEDDAWDTFETISLWVDGDMIAEVDASDEDEWSGSNDSEITFSGLDLFVEEDEDLEIIVAADIQNGLDLATGGNDWRITLQNDSLRFEDATGFVSEEGPQGGDTTADFTIEEEGSEDEIDVRTSSEDPDATTLPLEEDKKSDFVVFAFDLDAEDSDNDIEINQFVLGVDMDDSFGAATNTTFYVDDIRVLVDGSEVDTDNVDVEAATDELTSAGSNNGQIIVDFDNNDFIIEAGERVTVEIEVEFKSLSDEGATISLSIDGADVDAESSTDLEVGGAATGDEHTLRTEGAITEFTSSTETIKANSTDTANDDQGVFTLKFDVTAFDTDLFIAKTAASSTGTGSGVVFQITDGAGNLVGTTSVSAVLSSDAKQENGTDAVSRFAVRDGETKEFTLTVTYDPGIQGFYAVQLYGLNYKTANTAAAALNQQRFLPSEDYESEPLDI